MKPIAALLSLAGMLGATESPPLQRPNIIFIIADDLGWKDVGYAGSRFYRTPHIDRLAREGMHFPHYTHATGPNSTLLENDWKLIRFYNDSQGRFLLYNLATAPCEQKDLSADQPERVRAMDERLSGILTEMEAKMPTPNPNYNQKAKAIGTRTTTVNLAAKKHRIEEAQAGEGNPQKPSADSGGPAPISSKP